MRSLVLVVAAVFLAGCGPQGSSSPSQQPRREQSSGIVDTMAQGGNLRAGRETANKVRALSAEHNRDLNETGE